MENQFKNVYYLVRHGEAENNILGILNATARKEYTLTERGRKQTRELGEWLRSKPIDFMITSPLARTRETAEIIRDMLDVPLSVDMRLCEPQFGPFENQSISSFLDFMQTHGGRTVGDTELHIEGFMDIRERVRSFLEALEETFKGKHVVVVSHMDTLQELYAELLVEPVGAEQGGGGRAYSPRTASCLVVQANQEPSMFIPEGD